MHTDYANQISISKAAQAAPGRRGETSGYPGVPTNNPPPASLLSSAISGFQEAERRIAEVRQSLRAIGDAVFGARGEGAVGSSQSQSPKPPISSVSENMRDAMESLHYQIVALESAAARFSEL